MAKMNVRSPSVARIHRLGRKQANRPIILFFQDYNEKAGVFRNAKRLKGAKVFIQNDYCQNTLFNRKMLWESAKLNGGLHNNVGTLIHTFLNLHRSSTPDHSRNDTVPSALTTERAAAKLGNHPQPGSDSSSTSEQYNTGSTQQIITNISQMLRITLQG